MTTDHEIERVLDRWLSEGPIRPASSFLDDTLDRIDHAPRRHLAGRTRLPSTHLMNRFVAAAALVLAVAGVGAAALIQNGGAGSPGAGALPASLQAEWHPVGNRTHMGLSGDTFAIDLDIVIDPTTITIFEFHGDVINSTSLIGADRLDLRTISTGMVWHGKTLYCEIGDAATYMFRLSAGGTRLTLTPVSDTCMERAAILTGEWTRTDIGNLARGRRASAIFRPFTGGTGGQFAYTVPTGWAVRNENDERETSLVLGKTGPCQPPTRTESCVDVPDGPTITVFSSVVPSAPAAGCGNGATVDQTPLGYAEWLMTVPGLVVTTPTAVTIGGLSGVGVDLSASPGATGCDGSGIHTFSEGVQPVTQVGPLTVAGEKRARYYLLDAGQGRVLLIVVEARDAATWDVALAEAMPIVQSFEFTR